MVSSSYPKEHAPSMHSNNRATTPAMEANSSNKTMGIFRSFTPRRIKVARPVDVLLGRGKGSYEHSGNLAYKQMITSFVPAYVAAKRNKDKILITEEIMALVKNIGGRFLGFDEAELYEVSDAEARAKISQALRHQRSLALNKNTKTRKTNFKNATSKGIREEMERTKPKPKIVCAKPETTLCSQPSVYNTDDNRVLDELLRLSSQPQDFKEARDLFHAIEAEISEFSMVEISDLDLESIKY